MFNNVAALVLH